MNKIVEDIKNACYDLFDGKLFFSSLNKEINRAFVISGNDLSPALNNHNGFYEDINTLKWFNNFWIYIAINFKPIMIDSKFSKDFNKKKYYEIYDSNYLKIKNQYYNVIVSISVFQGGYEANEKKQLFRAEWDNFDNNKIHPQPHWHVYPEENQISEVNEIIDFDIEEKDDFLEDVSLQKIDFKRIHFAMNGQWAQNGEHIHKINDSKIIVNWLVGTLRHIKEQLEMTKRQKI
ncbi:MAG: hypothetical protein A2033_18530 [Bacteroidetes bacterium GWA2_31_9]|nr:MAG: hypothetical protein A2033_18530 [Bacteroidetes bacterium GWA2_31_9]